ncbi:hypothetical protein [Halomarina ordinaria]|uniref:Uncharacterized protein n=1 Tax=Halomarina ordinaria TaxID=3033939 RepID=A0ABD5U886_9EURY|nr:hypothetical protein [Halomarina sp. PSRA2]
MKFKVVPEPRPLSFVREAARTLPLVPGTEDDCCARLMADAGLPSRDAAREWLTFLRALGLLAESDGKFYQTRADLTDEDLARAFRERIHGASTVLDALATSKEPLTPAAAYGRVRETIPRWERSRRTDWERVWRERVERILEWAVVLDLATRVEAADEGEDEAPRYRAAE